MSIKPRKVDIFDINACTRCGICFHRCPELELPLEVAKKEINNLIEGKESLILYHCTTCFSCNLICPNNCKPYQLILERWNDLYQKRGAPPIYRFVCPTLEMNIWQMLYTLMSEKEKSWIRQWMNQDLENKDKPLLLIGNYVHLLPFIIGDSQLLLSYVPVDFLDHWECGAYLYQVGYLDLAKQIAEKCRADYNSWGVKTVVPLLDAVHWMLTTVFHDEFNVSHDLDVLHFNEWLLTQLNSKEIQLKKKIELKVTIHDNCYSKTGKGQYWDPPRELLTQVGCQITEMKHNRNSSLCCGFGAGASWQSSFRIVFDIMSGSMKKLNEAERTGADALVTYCGGCLYLLWAAKELFGSKLKIFHLVEIIRLGLDEDISFPTLHVKRAWDLIAIITYHIILSMFRKPFRITEIELRDKETILHSKPFRSLTILRMVFEIPGFRFFYKKMFQAFLPLMTTPLKY